MWKIIVPGSLDHGHSKQEVLASPVFLPALCLVGGKPGNARFLDPGTLDGRAAGGRTARQAKTPPDDAALARRSPAGTIRRRSTCSKDRPSIVCWSPGAPAPDAIERQQQQLVQPYVAEARRRSIAILGLIYPGADRRSSFRRQPAAHLDGVVLEGEFPPGFIAEVTRAMAAASRPQW